MKTKLIQTKDYLLFVEKVYEFKVGDWNYEEDNTIPVYQFDYNIDEYPGNKIIAYRRLSEEAKELDLPWLPNPFKEEVDIEDLAFQSSVNYYGNGNMYYKNGFINGYKAAHSKQFSLEDMIGFAKFYIIKHVIPYELDVISGKITDEQKVQMLKNDVDYDWNELAQEYIQSLSTQQLPKEFIPEYDKINDFGEPYTYDDMDFGVEIEYKLKTIINSESREELVGTYKY